MAVVLQLQDMTLQTGPLRFMRRSHLGWPPTPSAEAKVSPPPPGAEEQLLDLRAGDMCFMHGEMCHSGSQNTSAQLRMYLSTFICRLGYPHRDEFRCRAARGGMGEWVPPPVVSAGASSRWIKPSRPPGGRCGLRPSVEGQPTSCTRCASSLVIVLPG